MFKAYETLRWSIITSGIQQKLRNSAVKLFLSGKNPTDISKTRSKPSVRLQLDQKAFRIRSLRIGNS